MEKTKRPAAQEEDGDAGAVTFLKLPAFDQFMKDAEAIVKAKVARRIDALAAGNRGDAHDVGGKVYELRIHYGPGWRVYFAHDGQKIILLLGGGPKKSQDRDIRRAKTAFSVYLASNPKSK